MVKSRGGAYLPFATIMCVGVVRAPPIWEWECVPEQNASKRFFFWLFDLLYSIVFISTPEKGKLARFHKYVTLITQGRRLQCIPHCYYSMTHVRPLKFLMLRRIGDLRDRH